MPGAARKGDIGSAHKKCYPPSPAIEGSGDVFINGLPAVRQDDAYAVHGCNGCKPHERKASQGSSTVNINGKPAVRIGDAINCGGMAQTGSSNVNIGDSSWSGMAFDPIKPTLRLFVTQTPGNNNHSYSQEPYKLYYNGGLVQQGITDDEGCIEYEYDIEPPLNGELKIVCSFIEMKVDINSLAPPETDAGVAQRLAALGYYNTDGQGRAMTTGEGESRHQYFQGDQGDDVDGQLGEPLIKRLKPLMP